MQRARFVYNAEEESKCKDEVGGEDEGEGRRRRSRARAMRLPHHLLHRFAARRRRYPVHAQTSWGHHMLSLCCIGLPTAVPMQTYLAYVMFYRFSQSHRFIMISVSRVPCATYPAPYMPLSVLSHPLHRLSPQETFSSRNF